MECLMMHVACKRNCNLQGKTLEERLLKRHIAAPLSRIKRTNWGLFISLPMPFSPAKNSATEKNYIALKHVL